MPHAYLVLLILSAVPQNANPAQSTFLGCLNRRPDGTLQLKAIPSEKVYSIEGDTKPLMGYVNQIIRVQGSPKGAERGTSALQLTTTSVHVVAETCTAELPPSKTEAVGGKVGEDQVAVPETTTESSAETTPGFQTEAASEQIRGRNSAAVRSGFHTSVPYAPFKPEQVAQSEAAANVNAPAAARAEILPGNTLGVKSSEPASSPAAGTSRSKTK